VLERELDYWRRELGTELTTLNLPTDRPRPAVQTFRGARLGFGLSAAVSGALRGVSRQEGVTLFMTLLAAFQTLLAYHSGLDDIAVGTDVANRTRVETEGLIGFFVNQLVLRTDVSGDPSFRELLGRVREVCLGAYAHQDLPFEQVVEAVQPQRDLSRNPLFQIMFVLQNTPIPTLELPGLVLTPIEFDVGMTRFDMTLYLLETEQGLRGTVTYSTDLFESATINRLIRHLENLLSMIVAQPEARLGELKAKLSEADRQQRLIEERELEETSLRRLKGARRIVVSGSN